MTTSATKSYQAFTTQPLPDLFERYQLSKNYSSSQEEYSKKQEQTARDPKFKAQILPYILHHLFACKSMPTIQSYLSKKPEEAIQELINRQEPIQGLTCLHITVIQGNIEGSRELIRRGANVNLPDKNEFTPWLHTALLVDFKALKELLEKSGAIREQEQWDQLRKSAGFEPDIDSLKKCIQRNEKNENLPITLDDWKRDFQMESYSDCVVFQPTHHQHLWRLFFQHAFRDSKELLQPFTQKTLHPVELAIQDSLGVLPGIDAQRSKGLYLCKAIKQGDFVGWYGAKAIDLSKEPKLYQWQIQQKFQRTALMGDPREDYYALIDESSEVTADAYFLGNALRFANDGWPLLATFRFFGQRLGMFALQDLSANTELTWNYGLSNARLKWGHYKLLHKQEMINFLKGKNLKSLHSKISLLIEEQKKIREIQKYINKYFEVIDHEIKLKFIFETPSALIYLCINEIINATEAIELLKSNEKFREFLESGAPTHIPHYLWIAQILVQLEQIQQSLNQLPSSEKEMASVIRKFFNEEIIDHYSVSQVVKGVALLRDYLKLSVYNKTSLEKNWESFKSLTKTMLQQYSIEKDDEPPLAVFTSDRKFITLLNPRSHELVCALGSLKDVERGDVLVESMTSGWGESYTLRTYDILPLID